MKKVFYLLPLVLLPVLLVAGVFEGLGIKHWGTILPHSVSYRLQNQLYSNYEGQDLVPENRMNMHYCPNHHARLDSMTVDLYNLDFGGWHYAARKGAFSYNTAGMVESFTAYAIDDGDWEAAFKITAEYDSQNRMVLFCSYDSDYEGRRNLEPNTRTHIIYGAGSTFETFYWENHSINGLPYSHSVYQYDAQGRISQEFEYSSADSINWTEYRKIETTYHPQDTLTGAEYISFRSYHYPFMFIIDDDSEALIGKILQVKEYHWQNGSWIMQHKTAFTYDDQPRKISTVEEYYANMQWITDTRELFYYDANSNTDYTVKQDYIGDNNFVNSHRTDYNWETYTANSDLVQGPAIDLRLKAYPVPFANELNIIAESKSSAPLRVGIYNQRGQLVRELDGRPGTNLNWDGRDRSGKACSVGIYFLRASQGSSIATAKIVKLQ